MVLIFLGWMTGLIGGHAALDRKDGPGGTSGFHFAPGPQSRGAPDQALGFVHAAQEGEQFVMNAMPSFYPLTIADRSIYLLAHGIETSKRSKFRIRRASGAVARLAFGNGGRARAAMA